MNKRILAETLLKNNALKNMRYELFMYEGAPKFQGIFIEAITVGNLIEVNRLLEIPDGL